MRFPCERIVKELADSCPNSYHIGLYIYCRGFESEVVERKYYCKEEAEEIYQKKDLELHNHPPSKQQDSTNAPLKDRNGNFILIHGTAPGKGIPMDTKMAKDFCINFTMNRNEKKEVNIPDVFDSIISSEEFENQKCKGIKKVKL